MKLVASMLVRNERARYLDLAVGHLLTYCDEVRVLDDGSTDGTAEWLADQPDTYVLANPGAPAFQHEGRARNALLAWTMEGDPDYVLSIDADEFVGSPSRVRKLLEHRPRAVALAMREVWAASARRLSIRVDGGWGARRVPIVWRAPSRLGGNWRIPDRALACGREPMAVRAEFNIAPLGGDVLHLGWTRESERVQRHARYAEVDRGRFHARAHLDSILSEDVTLISEPWPRGLHLLASELAGRTVR